MKIAPIITRRRQRGFSLTEIAVVLGVVGLILAAIWTAASAAGDRNKINQAVQELQIVAQNMATLYQNRTLPAGCAGFDITSNVIAAGVIPNWAIFNSNPCKSAGHPWNQAPNAFTIGSGGNNFNINFWGVPLSGCIALLLQGTNCDPTQAGCPVSVMVSTGGAIFTPNSGPPKNWQNMTPAQANSLCTANGSYVANGAHTTNVVQFVFTL